jgi:hypothetical protein
VLFTTLRQPLHAQLALVRLEPRALLGRLGQVDVYTATRHHFAWL